jgi:hypothetical protein
LRRTSSSENFQSSAKRSFSTAALPGRDHIPVHAAKLQSKSRVRYPGIGFPVAYAVSGILLTVFGYFAMLLAQ